MTEQTMLNFSAPKELHFVVRYDYTDKKFSIDWATTNALLQDGQIYEGGWRWAEDKDGADLIAGSLRLRLEGAENFLRRPISENVVRIGRRSPKTSQIAAQRVLPRSGTKRKRVFELIQQHGERGLCDHEIEQITGWLHQSASSIRNSLMNDGWIKDSGRRRKTPQNNEAIVWTVVKPL